jgi:hypothetical protein
VRILRALFADLGLLTLAAVFGWALWYVVREELTEFQRREVQVAVEAPPGFEVTPNRGTVKVEVRGARAAVDAFRALHSPKIVRRVVSADLPQGVDETALDLRRDDFDFGDMLGGASLTVTEMDPPVVRVRVCRLEVQQKTVAPPEFQGATDLSLRHVLQSYTNTAKVRGAVSVLATFREIRTFVSKEQLQAFAENLRDSPKSTTRLDLQIDPSQRGLFTLVEPLQLSARVELSRVAEQELVLPIRVLDEPPRPGAKARRVQFAELNKPCFVRGDPPSVKLQFTGVPSALAALATGKVRAFVLADDLPPDRRNGDVPVHVADLPAGVALSQEFTVYVEETR